MADNLLRTIQSDLSGLSLDEARRAVQEAQQILSSLREQQQAAEKSVAIATKEVKKAQPDGLSDRQKHEQKGATGSSKKKDQYSDKTFWESRYKPEAAGAASLYEWYLSFEEWKPHLIQQLPASKGADLLVPGCGNSSLCEDLAALGFAKVSGFDYSPSVIDLMQKRLAATVSSLSLSSSAPIRYYTADAREMKDDGDDAYDSVIDKGTLDAIASAGGAENDSEGMVDAAKYMLQVWRILKTGGKFLVLSTMPPDIFHALAIEPLIIVNQGQPQKHSTICDWESAMKQSVKTSEGGDVFFYSISKLQKPSAALKRQVEMMKATPPPAKGRSKDDIMAGIHALLEEAKQAKLEMDAASARCAASASDAKAALSALDEVEKERREIEKKLGAAGSQATKHAEKMLSPDEEEAAEGAAHSSSSTSSSSSSSQRLGHQVQDTLKPPKVQLEIIYEESSCQAGQHVMVQYSLHDGEWDEDDALHLVCVSSKPAQSQGKDAVLLYTAQDDNKYEQLEYTVRPSACDSSSGFLLSGKVKVTLPSFCSYFELHYVRTLTSSSTVNGITTIQRKMNVLTRSEAFMVPSRVQGGHPDGIVPPLSVFTFASDPLIAAPNVPKSLRRRGAGPLSYTLLPAVEDLRSIRTLSVSFLCSPRTPSTQNSLSITRAMAWAFISTLVESPQQPPVINIVIEVDVASVDDPSNVTKELRTCYGLAPIVINDGIHVDLSGAQIDVEFGKGDKSDKVTCRLPYTIASANENATATEGGEQKAKPRLGFSNNLRAASVSQDAVKGAAVDGPVMSCGFCGNELVPHARIERALQLPSGLFDNVMHEFICSEVTPSMHLCMADMSTPERTVMLGPVQANTNPLDLVPGSVTFACKAAPTILDLFSGYGGSIATTPAASTTSVVDIDTCLVLCARCGSYLGDGQLAADCYCPTHTPGDEEAAASVPVDSNSNEFVLGDVRDVRLARYCIEMNVAPFLISPDKLLPSLTESTLSVEQGVARIVAHLNGVYTIGAFLLYVPQQETALLLRMLSRDYAVALPEHERGHLHEAIKISFLRGNRASLSLTGAEARVALQQHEFKAVSGLLQKRSEFFGQSIFKGHSLSVLLK